MDRFLVKEGVRYIYIYMHISHMWYTHTHVSIHTHNVSIHTHNGILLSHKKEVNNVICNNMDRPRDYHIRWSKSETEIQISYCVTYTWNLKYNRNELIYETEIDSQRDRLVVKGRVLSEGWIRGLGLADAN